MGQWLRLWFRASSRLAGFRISQPPLGANTFRKYIWRIPKGFHHAAWGCEERATPGNRQTTIPTPTGLHHQSVRWTSTLSGLMTNRTFTQGSSFLATTGLNDSTPLGLRHDQAFFAILENVFPKGITLRACLKTQRGESSSSSSSIWPSLRGRGRGRRGLSVTPLFKPPLDPNRRENLEAL